MSEIRNFVLPVVICLMQGCASSTGVTESKIDVEIARRQFPEGIGLTHRAELSDPVDTLRVWPADIIMGIDDRPDGSLICVDIIKTPFSPPTRPDVYVLVPDSLEVQLLAMTGDVVRATRGFFDAGQYSLYLDTSGIDGGVYFLKCERGEDVGMGRCYILK